MAALKESVDLDRIDIGDPAQRLAFYEGLIAHGAPLVREERMRAFCAGLIDEQGHVIDRSLLTDLDVELSAEQ